MNGHRIRSMIGGTTLAVVLAPSLTAAQQTVRPRQGPDLLLLQGPGADIRATVRALVAADRGPQGQRGVAIQTAVREGPAAAAGLRGGDIVTEFGSLALTRPR